MLTIQVSGRHIDIGDALRQYGTERLSGALSKYFGTGLDGHVIFSRAGGSAFHVEIRVHVSAGIDLEASAEAHEIYAAFDIAMERLDKRLRRYKRRLIEHHRDRHSAVAVEERPARAYILSTAAVDEQGEAPSDPLVIAETSVGVVELTVSEAVMRLELSNAPVLLFRNKSRGVLNVVFRRSDGHFGWIDPGDEPNA